MHVDIEEVRQVVRASEERHVQVRQAGRGIIEDYRELVTKLPDGHMRRLVQAALGHAVDGMTVALGEPTR